MSENSIEGIKESPNVIYGSGKINFGGPHTEKLKTKEEVIAWFWKNEILFQHKLLQISSMEVTTEYCCVSVGQDKD